MKTTSSKVILHMVSSLDGFIAKKDNSISWFETTSRYEKGETGQDPIAFLKTIDCYVMGSHTYELALELSKSHGWAYGETPTIVLTSRDFKLDKPHIRFHSGDVTHLFNEKLKKKYKLIWVAGGSMVAKELIKLQLVDEIRVSILPIILGEGLPFFDHIGQELLLDLKDTTAYKNGMVELCYTIKKE